MVTAYTVHRDNCDFIGPSLQASQREIWPSSVTVKQDTHLPYQGFPQLLQDSFFFTTLHQFGAHLGEVHKHQWGQKLEQHQLAFIVLWSVVGVYLQSFRYVVEDLQDEVNGRNRPCHLLLLVFHWLLKGKVVIFSDLLEETVQLLSWGTDIACFPHPGDTWWEIMVVMDQSDLAKLLLGKIP